MFRFFIMKFIMWLSFWKCVSESLYNGRRLPPSWLSVRLACPIIQLNLTLSNLIRVFFPSKGIKKKNTTPGKSKTIAKSNRWFISFAKTKNMKSSSHNLRPSPSIHCHTRWAHIRPFWAGWHRFPWAPGWNHCTTGWAKKWIWLVQHLTGKTYLSQPWSLFLQTA